MSGELLVIIAMLLLIGSGASRYQNQSKPSVGEAPRHDPRFDPDVVIGPSKASVPAPFGRKALTVIALLIIVMLTAAFLVPKMVEIVEPDEIVVIQDPFTGTLEWHTTPGYKWQNFGNVTRYEKRTTVEFDAPVRFNEGVRGKIKGSFSYSIPSDTETAEILFLKYGSQKRIDEQLVNHKIMQVAREIASEFTAEDAYTNLGRKQLADEFSSQLNSTLNEAGLPTHNVVVYGIGIEQNHLERLEEHQRREVERMSLESERDRHRIISGADNTLQARLEIYEKLNEIWATQATWSYPPLVPGNPTVEACDCT